MKFVLVVRESIVHLKKKTAAVAPSVVDVLQFSTGDIDDGVDNDIDDVITSCNVTASLELCCNAHRQEPQ